jgi:catechol 2,3-dioxygenase-like lactoylglutathione lyase family enzyme
MVTRARRGRYHRLVSDPFPAARTELTHLLVVADIEASRRWYEQVLGATVHRAYGGTSVVLQLLGQWLLLVTGGEPTADKPTVMFAAPPNPDVVSAEMIFGVADCRRVHDELRARGAAFLAPPVEYPWEIRAFFRDPDGHLFEISEARNRD